MIENVLEFFMIGVYVAIMLAGVLGAGLLILAFVGSALSAFGRFLNRGKHTRKRL